MRILTTFIDQLKFFLNIFQIIKENFNLIRELISDYSTLIHNLYPNETNEERKNFLESQIKLIRETWEKKYNQTEQVDFYLKINPYTVKEYLANSVLIKIDDFYALLKSRLDYHFFEYRLLVNSEDEERFKKIEAEWINKLMILVLKLKKVC